MESPGDARRRRQREAIEAARRDGWIPEPRPETLANGWQRDPFTRAALSLASPTADE